MSLLQRSKFSKYLAVKEELPCAFDLMNKEIQILNIGWATESNFLDCGIFVMRHMECYKGNGLADFNTHFNTEENGQQKQLDDLRRKYLAKMLLSDFNDIAEHTRDKVKDYDRLDNNLRLKHQKAAKAKIKKRIASTLGA